MKLTAQQKANKKQDAARKNQPRYMLRMTKDESEILDSLEKVYGTKKAAIIKALNSLKEELESSKV